MTRPCSCGCGQPATNRGGYNSRLDLTLWFATTRCHARFETATIQTAAKAKEKGTPILYQDVLEALR